MPRNRCRRTLTVKKQTLIQAVRDNPGLNMYQLSRACGVAVHAVNRIMPELQAYGYVYSVPDGNRFKWYVFESPTTSFPDQLVLPAQK